MRKQVTEKVMNLPKVTQDSDPNSLAVTPCLNPWAIPPVLNIIMIVIEDLVCPHE